MTTFLEMSISADGFVAGPGTSREHPLGEGGEALHAWMERDPAAASALFERTGAFVIGRRMFDVGIHLWGEDGAFRKPVFVVTHRPADMVIRGATTFAFAPGLREAVASAREAAGREEVCVVGGGAIARQALAAGLVGELRLHHVPHLLGRGERIYEGRAVGLEQAALVEGAGVLHVTYRVMR